MFDDFKDLLSAFNAANVRYLVVGGHAVSLHSQPRATKDLDIFIATDAQYSAAVLRALARFGAPVEGLSAADFREPESFFRMGALPVMVDIMPRISGVEFEGAWQRRVDVEIDDKLIVPFISRDCWRPRFQWVEHRTWLMSPRYATARSKKTTIRMWDQPAVRLRRTRLDERKHEVVKSGLKCGESRRQRN
jgi:hypothetical protein